jgi:hypothetical protein
MIAADAQEAHKILSDLKSGRKPKWKWPKPLRNSYNKLTGASI